MKTQPSRANNKYTYGYHIDPYDEESKLSDIDEVSDKAIVSSILAALGICCIVSVII